MDKDKLNEAAKDIANRCGFDDFDKDSVDFGFKAGTDWLLSQPLADRLTDKEKEKIKGYLIGAKIVYAHGGHASLEGIRDMFFDIFGKELFNGK